MVITDIIQTLKSDAFYGAGKHTEIAKGKNEMATDFKGFVRKAKRLIKS